MSDSPLPANPSSPPGTVNVEEAVGSSGNESGVPIATPVEKTQAENPIPSPADAEFVTPNTSPENVHVATVNKDTKEEEDRKEEEEDEAKTPQAQTKSPKTSSSSIPISPVQSSSPESTKSEEDKKVGEKVREAEREEEKEEGAKVAEKSELQAATSPNPTNTDSDRRDESDGEQTPGVNTGNVNAPDTPSNGDVNAAESKAALVELSGAGKPGYLGGTHGIPEDYDSDDSLMTTSRRDSQGSGSGGVLDQPTIMGFTRRQVLTLLVFGLADFFSAIIISLQAPFYPNEAEKKGATSTEYGLVFGVFELVVFIMSPIYGRYLHKLGPKLVFNVGIFTTGVCTILFGLLGLESLALERTSFITLSFIVRILEAMGDAAFITASFAIIATEFPTSVATTFASLETFFGLGLIVGPTLGGALFEVGGFSLPFSVMGGLLLVVAVLTLFLMPNPKPHSKLDKNAPGGILAVLKVPTVFLAALNIVAGAITIGFLNATLEPHIRQFNLTPVLTGLIFIINGGLYAISAPIWGFICDRQQAPKYVILIGAVLVGIGFLIIGPVPFIPVDTMLWLTCVGLVIHGLGLGATLVSSFIMALRESINHGFSDNIQTYGLTSALWTSSFALGSFIGPSVGGVLLFYVEFRYASLFVFAVQIFIMILILVFISNSKTTPGKSFSNLAETAPLLGSSNGKNNDPCSSKSIDKTEAKSYGSTELEC